LDWEQRERQIQRVREKRAQTRKGGRAWHLCNHMLVLLGSGVPARDIHKSSRYLIDAARTKRMKKPSPKEEPREA
jgi:hypothetical protein